VKVSVMLHQNEMLCKDEELVSAFEENYKSLRHMGYQHRYTDYVNTFLSNGCMVDTETSTKNHLFLTFYKQCSKYNQKLYPKLLKEEVYDIMKGVYDEKYFGSNQIMLDF